VSGVLHDAGCVQSWRIIIWLYMLEAFQDGSAATG